METFTLSNNRWQFNTRENTNSYEVFKSRLVRVDLPRRTGSRDILRHYLQKSLRAIWFFAYFRQASGSSVSHIPPSESPSVLERNSSKQSYQNTAQLVDFLTRFIVAISSCAFLVVPLATLSTARSHNAQLALISVFIVLFCLLISSLSKASNQEIMTASAAYAAVLVVFLAASPDS